MTTNPGSQRSHVSFSLWSNGAHGPVLPTFNKLPERWTNPITGIGPDGNAVGAGGVMSPTGDLSTGDLTIGDLSTGDLSTGDLTIGVVNGGSAVRSCPCYKIAIPTRQDSLLFTDVPYTDPQFSHTSSGPAPFVGLTVSEDERELWYTAPVQNHRA